VRYQVLDQPCIARGTSSEDNSSSCGSEGADTAISAWVAQLLVARVEGGCDAPDQAAASTRPDPGGGAADGAGGALGAGRACRRARRARRGAGEGCPGQLGGA